MIQTMRSLYGDLKYARFNSGIARNLLRRYYRTGEVYRVRYGPLKGIHLRYDVSIDIHMMLGLWELESFRLLALITRRISALKQQIVAADVGANIGLYSLWLGRKLARNGTVHAFEPVPSILPRLKDHIRVNELTNIVVVDKACSDRIGNTEFFIGYHHHVSSLLKDWVAGDRWGASTIVVSTTTLDDYFLGPRNREGPDLIKMDIEGGGIYALAGATRTAKERRPFVIIESHLPAEDEAISRFVTDFGYDAWRIGERQWVRNPSAFHPDPDGIWGSLFLCPNERRYLFPDFK